MSHPDRQDNGQMAWGEPFYKQSPNNQLKLFFKGTLLRDSSPHGITQENNKNKIWKLKQQQHH